MMKLMEYTGLVQNKMAFVNFLTTMGIFLQTIQCSRCAAVCQLNKDTLQYRCLRSRPINKKKAKKSKKKCNFKRSARKGTFFYGRIGLQRMGLIVGYFLELPRPRVHFMQRELNLSVTAVVHWSNYCREVCMKWAEENLTKLGGVGKIVEVGQAKFGKRKYNRGQVIWLFGGIERGSRRIFLVPVEDITARTLIDIIKDWIEPGTTIMSDNRKGYSRLGEEGFQHLTVNHSYHFVDPDSGASTQSVKRMWRDVRANIPKYGMKKSHFQGYISEYLFKRVNRPCQRIEKFLETARNMYRN